MKIGFIEPHLKLFGGIRHVLEIGNELVRLGHDVRLYIPRGQENRCHWMECLPEVRYLGAPEADALDAIVFNNEPDFAWLDRFASARLKVYWLLHFAWLYDKAFSWLSYRCPVDVHLAESRWIAQCLQREIGVRAVVINSGVNPRHFRPLAMAKTYEVLCYGDRERDWKGTGDIEAACRLLDLPLEKYDGKGIPQERMAEEYGRAKVFVHGSWYEGFGLPGLEALACGVPLVTTDSGGPRDYAFHEQTALIVPPRDPRAMADAIRRLRGDPDLAARLVHQGLDLVARQFQWPAKARELERVLAHALELGDATAAEPPRAGPAAAVAAPTHIAVAAPRSPGAGRMLNAALRAATSELVVVGDDDPPAVAAAYAALCAHGDRAALACVATGALGELPPFSHAPACRGYVARRTPALRSGGFGEGLQGYDGTEDFLLWNLWWHGFTVLGPVARTVREPPRNQHLLRTFAALGAAHARFLYGIPRTKTASLRPYGVEASWARGPCSVPELSYEEALALLPERPLQELLTQLEQRRALPFDLKSLWRELDPSVASLVRSERERRVARDELMRDVRAEKQRNAEALRQLEESYSAGQAQWNQLLAERELVRATLAEQAERLRATARDTWNVAVLIVGSSLGLWLATRAGWPRIGTPLATQVLSAAAVATLLQVAWQAAWSLLGTAGRGLEGAG